MTQPTFRDLLATEMPLVMPGAYDALSARLIDMADFKACFIGGYALVGARHALPDLGLVGFGEMRNGIADILSATDLPLLVDADNGYGDLKNVTRTVRVYERMGVTALFIEDQTSPKRCGHMAGTGVVPAEDFAAKIRAAARARRNPDTFLIARTDSRAINGLDDALRRAELCLKAGADGVYIEAPQSVAELERIGQSFDAPLLVDLAEGGPAPFLTPKELASLGFAMVIYPTALIYRVAAAYRKFLDGLKRGEVEPSDAVTFEDWKRIMRFDDWAEAESGFGERR